MTLVEVLVALVIFAVGLLGASGLILSSLRSSQFSGNASIAMSLARDYGEIMQLIPPSVESTTASGTNDFAIDTASTIDVPSAKCKGTACNATQLIALNTWEWAQRVKGQLPGGRAVACKDSTPRDSSSGLYKWECDGSGNLMVIKFGWEARSGPAGTGDDTIVAKDANNLQRPKLVITLFGNQQELEHTAP